MDKPSQPLTVPSSEGLGPAPTRASVERLMKRCQIGVGGRGALDEAHSIMAECYGTLGRLMLETERLARAAADNFAAASDALDQCSVWEERARHLGWRDGHGA